MKKDAVIQFYQDRFTAFEQSLNGGASAPVHQQRRVAFDRFVAAGFPTTRDEDWKYTNLNRIAEKTFAPAPLGAMPAREDIAARAIAVPDAWTLLFVNGRFEPALSDLTALPDAVEIRTLPDVIDAQALPAWPGDPLHGLSVRNPFIALNTAFLHDGVTITVRRGAVVERPLHLLFWSTAATEPFMTHPRVIVDIETGAQCTLIEQYAAAVEAVYFTNTVADLRVADGATLQHVKLQDESTAATHVATVHATVGQAGTYAHHSIGFGAALQRSNVHGVLEGEGAHCTMNGIFLPFGTQHMDHFTTIDHAVANCTSHELYKGVLSDETRGVFTGKIIVRQDAQKTDARQANNNLLLSDLAQIDTRPQLEIFADDVKCTHGATVGRISDEQLFYLMSRGIGRRQAHNILTFAFAGDVVSRIPLEALRTRLEAELHTRLDASWNK